MMSSSEALPIGVAMLKAMMSRIEDKGSHLRTVWTELLALISDYQEQLALKETEIFNDDNPGSRTNGNGDKELRKVQAELSATKEELRKAETSCAAFEASEKELLSDLSTATAELDTTKEELKEAKKFQVKFDVAQDELVKIRTELKEKLEKSDNTRRELVVAQEELEKVRTKHWATETELKDKLVESEKIREELKDIRDELTKSEKNNAELEVAQVDLKDELRESEKIRAELKATLGELQEELEKSETIRMELKDSMEELKTNLNVVSEELLASQEEVRKLENDLAGLRDRPTFEQLKETEGVKADLRASQEELQAKFRLISKELETSREKMKNYEHELSLKKGEIEKAEDMRKTLEKHQDELQKDLAVMNEELFVKNNLIEKIQQELKREVVEVTATGSDHGGNGSGEQEQTSGDEQPSEASNNAPAEYKLVISDLGCFPPGTVLPTAEIVNLTPNAVKIELPQDAKFIPIGSPVNLDPSRTSPVADDASCRVLSTETQDPDGPAATFGDATERDDSMPSIVPGSVAGCQDTSWASASDKPADTTNRTEDENANAEGLQPISSDEEDMSTADAEETLEPELSAMEDELPALVPISDEELEFDSDMESDRSSSPDLPPVLFRQRDNAQPRVTDTRNSLDGISSEVDRLESRIAGGGKKSQAPTVSRAVAGEGNATPARSHSETATRETARPTEDTGRRKSDTSAVVSPSTDREHSKSNSKNGDRQKDLAGTRVVNQSQRAENDTNKEQTTLLPRPAMTAKEGEARKTPTSTGDREENSHSSEKGTTLMEGDRQKSPNVTSTSQSREKLTHNTKVVSNGHVTKHSADVDGEKSKQSGLHQRNAKDGGDVHKRRRKRTTEDERMSAAYFESGLDKRESIYDTVKSRRGDAVPHKKPREQQPSEPSGRSNMSKDGGRASDFGANTGSNDCRIDAACQTSWKDFPRRQPAPDANHSKPRSKDDINPSSNVGKDTANKVSKSSSSPTAKSGSSSNHGTPTTKSNSSTAAKAGPTPNHAAPTAKNQAQSSSNGPPRGHSSSSSSSGTAAVKSPTEASSSIPVNRNSERPPITNPGTMVSKATQTRSSVLNKRPGSKDTNVSKVLPIGEKAKPGSSTQVGIPPASNGPDRSKEKSALVSQLMSPTRFVNLSPLAAALAQSNVASTTPKPLANFKIPLLNKKKKKPLMRSPVVSLTRCDAMLNSHSRRLLNGTGRSTPNGLMGKDEDQMETGPSGEGKKMTKRKAGSEDIDSDRSDEETADDEDRDPDYQPVAENITPKLTLRETSSKHKTPVLHVNSTPMSDRAPATSGARIPEKSSSVSQVPRKEPTESSPTDKQRNTNPLTCKVSQVPRKETTESSPTDKQRNTNPLTCKDCGKVFTCKSSLIQHGLVHILKKYERNRNQTIRDVRREPAPPVTAKRTGNAATAREVQPRVREVGAFPLPIPEGPIFNTGAMPDELQDNLNESAGAVIEDKDLGDGRSVLGFTCKFCGKLFKMQSFLDRHLVLHTQDSPFRCDYCDQRFTRRSTLVAHIRIHTREKPFKCKVCGKGFSRSNSLGSHMITHSNELPWKCDICGKKFPRKSTLKQHVDVLHKREGRHDCHICGKKFIHNSSLHHHLKMHAGIKSHKCELCEKTYVCRSSLEIHMRWHTGEKPYECLYCGKFFRSIAHRNTHQLRHRVPAKKKWECQQCGKKFLRRGPLKVHENVHNGIKPYSCEQCGRKFHNPYILKRHEFTHTGTKEFKCDICGKEFLRASSLRLHGLVHSNETPFKCEVCFRSFKRKNTLSEHMRTHSDVKPFHCRFCGMGISTKFILKKHERRSHGAELEELEKKESESNSASNVSDTSLQTA